MKRLIFLAITLATVCTALAANRNFNATGVPAFNAAGSSAAIRNEFAAISAGFAGVEAELDAKGTLVTTISQPGSDTNYPSEAAINARISAVGGGDVSSDTSVSVDGEVALFSGTLGKTIKRGIAYGNLSSQIPVSNGTVNTKLNADMLDGYHAANTTGKIPISNGTVNTDLNADKLDGYHAGNGAGALPISNGTVNTSLNADTVDGFHAGNSSGQVPVSNGTVNTNLNSDMLEGFHASQTPAANQIPVYDANSTLPNPLKVKGVSGVSKIEFYDDAGTTKYAQLGDSATDGTKLIISSSSGAGIELDAGGGSVTIGTNTAWHAGNDGAASGLDADLLDGQHGSYYQPASDARLKKNIKTVSKALETLDLLHPVEYQWNEEGDRIHAGRPNKGTKELGLIAQEVQAVLPDAVMDWIKDDPEGQPYLTIDYRAITSLLISAVQDLAAQVKALKGAK